MNIQRPIGKPTAVPDLFAMRKTLASGIPSSKIAMAKPERVTGELVKCQSVPGNGTEPSQQMSLMSSSTVLMALQKKKQAPKMQWRRPWKLHRVIQGHSGWVRSVDVDPSNEWFVTGATDKMIKIWDLASGVLRLTLTGHTHAVRAVRVHPQFKYLFSAGEDNM